MISESEAVRRVISVCPGFQDVWRQHLNFAHDDGEYIHINVVAEWVVDQAVAGDHDCLPELFVEVERILDGASCDVRNLMVIGLLEDIQLFALGKLEPKPGFDPDVILGLLGPQSRREWFSLIARYWDAFEPGRWRWSRADSGC
jgi:hypothetical protein